MGIFFVLHLFALCAIFDCLDSKQQEFQLIGKYVNGAFAAKQMLTALGGPLCKAMEIYFGKLNCTPSDCGLQKHNMSSTAKKIIVSYGHNGLGNQLWQHHFAQSVAMSTGSKLYITQIPSEYTFQSKLPPNTEIGSWVVRKALDRRFLFKSLGHDHRDRMSCLQNNFSFFDRGVDRRRIAIDIHSQQEFTQQLLRFLGSSGEVRCMVLLGFFQSKVQIFRTRVVVA
jgi:hypothetical protein